MKKVIIMRGLPGSGKSTKAVEYISKALQGVLTAVVVSADDYFMASGEYKFDPTKLGEAHARCLKLFLEALKNGVGLVVVDNTNTELWEYQNYLNSAEDFGYEVLIDLVDSNLTDEELFKRNTHGVPLETIKKMRERLL